MAGEFLQKLALLGELREQDRQAFCNLFRNEKSYAEGETVFLDEAEQKTLYVVKSGWFYSYAILPDGGRQIHEIFTTGDIIGVEHLSWVKSTSCVAAASDGVLQLANISDTRQFLMSHPYLNAVFYALHMVHNVLLLDRVTAVSRLGAYHRLAYFLADALTRQNLIAGTDSHLLYLPLSQSFIADCLGLSSVHVSRQVGKLIDNGVIRKQGRYGIEVTDPQELLRLSDYKNRFERLDWIRPEDYPEAIETIRSGEAS